MRVYLQYNSKSRGQNVPRANKLAMDIGFEPKDKYYVLSFEDPEDPMLREFYELVGDLKGSRIFIKEPGETGEMEEIPINVRGFFKILECPQKSTCNGICTWVKFDKLSLEVILEKYGRYISDDTLMVYEPRLLTALDPFLKRDSKNTFIVDKEELLKSFQEQALSVKRFCSQYDEELVKEQIEELPQLIYFLPVEQLISDFSQKWAPQFFQILQELTSHAVLGNELNINERLTALKGLRMLRYKGHPVEGTEIWMNFRSNEKNGEILLWKAESTELSEIETDELMEAVVTKKDGVFALETPFATIYYTVCHEDKETMQMAWRALQKI